MSVILCGGGNTGVASASGLSPGAGLLNESLECNREVKDRRMARSELSSLSLSLAEAIEAMSEMLWDVEDSLRGNM